MTRVPSRPTIVTVVAPMWAIRSSPAHRHGTEHRASSRRARAWQVPIVVASATNGAGNGWKCGVSSSEARPDRLAGDIAAGLEPRVHALQQRLIDRRQGRGARNRDQRLAAQGFAPRFDAAFVVAFARPTKTRLKEVMRRERGKPWRQGALAADEDPHDRGAEIVVRRQAGTPSKCAKARRGHRGN